MDFNNTKIAFQDKTEGDLRRAKFLFNSIRQNWLVMTGKVALGIAQKVHFPIGWAIKPTLYRHFVGGETIAQCEQVVEKLAKSKVQSILDYSVEGTSTEQGINNAFEETLRTIDNAATNANIPFAVFKPTAMIDTRILKKISFKESVSDEEQEQYKAFAQRIDSMAQKAFDSTVRLLIDAEDYWFQQAIDDVVEEMMLKYNKERVVVFNTLQMYRTDRLEYLKNLIAKARTSGFFVGVKFVRGAYMEKERARAEQEGYPSPINATKDDTDKMYNDALRISMEHIDILNVFNGTHNEESNLLLAQIIEDKKLAKNDARVYFSQLYGMSDHISYNLAEAGYNVAKYIPYGPVKHVAPYLIRRAEENTSVAGQTGRELSLILKEQNRRKTENQ
jgi:proline dehydrogenase